MSASEDSYRCEFFGPDFLYRVSSQDGETLVDVADGLGYRHVAALESHAAGVALVGMLLSGGAK